MKRMLVPFLAVAALGVSAAAQTRDSTHGKWDVYRTGEGKDSVCYAIATPESSAGAAERASEPHVIMTYRGSSKKYELSVSVGYAYRHSDAATLVVGKKTTRLYAEDVTAWAHDETEDAKILADLLGGGKQFVVHAIAQDKRRTSDTYALEGFADATKRAKNLCDALCDEADETVILCK